MIKYVDLFAGIGGFSYGIEKARICTCGEYQRKEETGEEGSGIISESKQPDQPDIGGNNLDSNRSSDPRTEVQGPGTPDREEDGRGLQLLEQPGRQRLFSCIGFSEIDRYASSIYRRHYPGVREFGDITAIRSGDVGETDFIVGGFPCQAFSIAGKRLGFEDIRGTLFFEIARLARDLRPRYLLLENVKGLLSHQDGETFQSILGVLADLGYDVQWGVLNSKFFGVPQNRERVFFVGYLGGEGRREVFLNPVPDETFNGDIRLVAHRKGYHRNTQVFDPEGITETLDTGEGGGRGHHVALETKTRVRRLTPVECCRLQAFPDDWCSTGIDEDGNEIKISDSQQYKCLGNAVTTSVITWLIERMFA